MNKKHVIKKRIKSYLESIMFEPMEKELFEAIAKRVERILIEEEYEFGDISVEDNISVKYEMTPALPSEKLIVTIKGKYDIIKVSVDYKGRVQIGDKVINWNERDMEDM